MQHSILFKNVGLTVLQASLMEEGSADEAKIILKCGALLIPLEKGAAEVLVGYLQVMRAYLIGANYSRQDLMLVSEEVASHLSNELKSGRKIIADSEDISKLIKKMGCLHDWNSRKTPLLPGQKFR